MWKFGTNFFMNKFKLKKKWIFLFLLVGLGIFVSLRWNTWFGNIPEPPYTVSEAPHRILLTMGNSGENSRIVTWQADAVVKEGELTLCSQKEIARTVKASCELVRSRSGKVAFYRVEIKDLSYGGDYRFSVKSGEKSSGTYHFSVPAQSDSASFVFMGDVQEDTARGLSNGIFNAINTRFPNADFWLFGGDLVERPIDDYWQVTFDDVDTIATTKTVLAIPGNHEYLKGFKRQLDTRFGPVFGYFQQSKVGENHVFSFSYHGARFFMLDSNTDAFNLPSQRGWLKEELQKATEKWKVVVIHHPLYSNKGEHYNPLVKWAFKDLVEEYGVDLVLQAHEHVYARYNVKDANGGAVAPLYLSTYCSPKQYQLHFKVPEDRIGTNDRFYQCISYNADSLNISTYTASNGKQYDGVTITKGADGYAVKDYFKGQPEKVEISEWFRQNKKKHIKEYEKDIELWRMAK